MKIGAGGPQVQAAHDELTGRQAQESRRTDYQQKPVSVSENAGALNHNALNQSVEKNHRAPRAYNPPRQARGREENRRDPGRDGPGCGEDRPSGGEETGSRDATGARRGFKLDKYI